MSEELGKGRLAWVPGERGTEVPGQFTPLCVATLLGSLLMSRGRRLSRPHGNVGASDKPICQPSQLIDEALYDSACGKRCAEAQP